MHKQKEEAARACGNCLVPFMKRTTLCSLTKFSRADFNSGDRLRGDWTEEASTSAGA